MPPSFYVHRWLAHELYGSIASLHRDGDEALLREPLDDSSDAFLDALLVGLDGDLGVVRGLVGGADAGKVGDLAGAGLLVEPLGVTLLGDLEGDVGEDFDEGDPLVVGGGPGSGSVQVTRDLPVGLEGGDE